MNARSVGIVVILAAAAVALPRGADAAQQRPNPPTTAAADVTSCAQAQMVVDQLLATAMVRVDAARQTNTAADLRVAVDSLQSTIRDARAQLRPCATATPDQPMDHSKMAMGQPADTTQHAVDPVCGLKVEPASAPQATHQGRAYSFCSEQHRELFQKTPAKYLPRGK